MVTCPWCGTNYETFRNNCKNCIPSHIRNTLGVKPGQNVQVILYSNRIEMIPVRPVRESRGFLKGIDTSVEREAEGTDFETIPGVKYIEKV